MRALLTLLTAIAALGLADSARAATIAKVIDGDTVALKDGRRVNLLGVEVPPCYAGQARAKLRQLLPAKARVRVKADGRRAGRYLFRGSKLVNAELIRAGAASASADGLEQASKLNAAETAAKTAARGLWTTCAPAPAPTPAPAPAPPAADATQRARTDLQGRVFIHITTTTFSSAESRLHLCSDGSYVEEVTTDSDLGGSTAARYTGRWTVVSATYDATGARASVRRDNADGTTGWVEFAAAGTTVTVNGNAVSVQTSGVCP